ncbi:Mannose-6-phosphate isomerase, cupin superfamily [Andreprevotia lacus DSM 23236]|jgi:mannose-6-phosphate isomerase-like protein (cupin superfamily)|uniref:Mannose-6-phosphate isomerase, cupin superfamily n=1 Tax=Andreprevotia lacus DSM 23236 TaxID=1121001 RepID=A0A1W1XHZ9_9NEIS|nr:cupin domain-containing protein [Andreprevotia lacus]SMC23404.1 Mannose-6-phosphate isomerase, cupin superfamily [Andreprevotia lacus DSM 23236]
MHIPADKVIYLPPGAGRSYKLGGMRSVFKADGTETTDRYSISEWWLDAGQAGPGAHVHDSNDDIFYVLAGTITFLVDEQEIDAGPGSFIRVPAGIVHDFCNRSGQQAGMLNIYIPGGFETDMPDIVAWFEAHAQG